VWNDSIARDFIWGATVIFNSWETPVTSEASLPASAAFLITWGYIATAIGMPALRRQALQS
jgi:hypothetical protein